MVPDILPVASLALKIFVLIGLSLYTVFALVLVRQEQLMAHVLEESSESLLRLLVYIHLLASVVVVAAAFLFL